MASYPKSGNTWVRIFLHSIIFPQFDINRIPELHEIPIASDRKLIDQYLGVNSSDLIPSEIRDYRPEIYRKLSEDNTGLKIIKVHDAFSFTTQNEPLFPPEVSKAVIYIVRNPLDVAVSYSFHSSNSIQRIIDQMNDPLFEIAKNDIELKSQISQYIGTWSDHVKSWTQQHSIPTIVIKYEQLLENNDLVFKRLLERLCIPYNNNVFQRALKNSNFHNLKNLEENYGFSEKSPKSASFFREGKKSNYKNYLSTNHIRQLVLHHGEMMKKLGYKKV